MILFAALEVGEGPILNVNSLVRACMQLLHARHFTTEISLLYQGIHASPFCLWQRQCRGLFATDNTQVAIQPLLIWQIQSSSCASGPYHQTAAHNVLWCCYIPLQNLSIPGMADWGQGKAHLTLLLRQVITACIHQLYAPSLKT